MLTVSLMTEPLAEDCSSFLLPQHKNMGPAYGKMLLIKHTYYQFNSNTVMILQLHVNHVLSHS